MRATALTFETCHHAFSWGSLLTRSSTRAACGCHAPGSRIRIPAIASAGVRRVSRTASAETGPSMRCSISASMSSGFSLAHPVILRIPPDAACPIRSSLYGHPHARRPCCDRLVSARRSMSRSRSTWGMRGRCFARPPRRRARSARLVSPGLGVGDAVRRHLRRGDRGVPKRRPLDLVAGGAVSPSWRWSRPRSRSGSASRRSSTPTSVAPRTGALRSDSSRAGSTRSSG